MNEDSQMLNPRQVAEILGVHQKTVHLWLRSGRLQGIKISYRAWRIPQSALDSFLADNSNARFRQSRPAHDGTSKSTKEPAPVEKHSTLKQSTLITEKPDTDDSSTQSRMKHYIRDIMGEQPPEE